MLSVLRGQALVEVGSEPQRGRGAYRTLNQIHNGDMGTKCRTEIPLRDVTPTST